ncbi:MAG: hypothetical protein ACO3TI_07625, partial [Aquiluna sp.]
SGAVYFRLVSEGIPEQIRDRGHHPRFVLNDADSRIVQLFRTCRDYPELLAHAVKYTPYSREEHRLAQQGIEGIEDEIEQARRYLVGNWQSVSGELNKMGSKAGWSFDRVLALDETKEKKSNWHTLPTRILAASPHLQGYDVPGEEIDRLKAEGLTLLEALEELGIA